MTMSDVLLPCQNCGEELQGNPDATATTTTVKAKPNPHFSGDSVKDVPALICPECGEVTAL